MTDMNEAPKRESGGGDGVEPLLKLRGIDKHFGPVQALYGVDLDLPAGQGTGLCGDNGAGKSVLTRCIAGVHQPDHGQINFEGRPVHIRSATDAAALGIETVYQDLALADNQWRRAREVRGRRWRGPRRGCGSPSWCCWTSQPPPSGWCRLGSC